MCMCMCFRLFFRITEPHMEITRPTEAGTLPAGGIAEKGERETETTGSQLGININDHNDYSELLRLHLAFSI